ncbi:tail fiber domain-containing protein [Bacillus sp. SH8-8]|uniref:tail fiber domain-containing protein n=1 Tax=Bacillus sp. SH8-8 TaxID=2217830 RepID=UPI0034D751BE
MTNVKGDSNDPRIAAIFGDSSGGPGVWGNNKRDDQNASGVLGTSEVGVGVWGKGKRLAGMFEGSVQVISGGEGFPGGDLPTFWAENKKQHPNASAVLGTSRYGPGVIGQSIEIDGVIGMTKGIGKAGVLGISETVNGSGNGVVGRSVGRRVGEYGIGVFGEQFNSYDDNGIGVLGKSNRGVGVKAESSGMKATLAVQQGGGGDIIVGGNSSNGFAFRVLNNGNVQTRGVNLTSDKNEKENFSSINTLEILDKVANMPIQSWNYKADTSSECHIGPTAQDFHATFGLNGDDDKHISSVDIQGIALAAIQGLNEKLMAENAQLHAKLDNLEERLSALESKD